MLNLISYFSASPTPIPDSVNGILGGAADVITQVLTWVGDIASTIVTTPLLFIGVGLFVLGAAVSFVRRLLRR
jgi:hypothetical protein